MVIHASQCSQNTGQWSRYCFWGHFAYWVIVRKSPGIQEWGSQVLKKMSFQKNVSVIKEGRCFQFTSDFPGSTYLELEKTAWTGYQNVSEAPRSKRTEKIWRTEHFLTLLPQKLNKFLINFIENKKFYIVMRFFMNTYLLTYSMKQSPSWEANWFCS